MNILVTGASGSVGKEVVKDLAKSNVKVRAAMHAKSIEKVPGVDYISLDLSDNDSIRKAVSGMDKIFLLTPNAENAVEMVRMVVDEAKRANVQHIVRLSAMGAENTDNPLLLRHHEAEQIIRESKIPYTIIRPAMFMQNFLTYMGKMIRDNKIIAAPAGEGKMALVDVRDIAMVASKVLTSGAFTNKVIEVTGKEAISFSEAAKILSRITGSNISYMSISEAEARKGMQDMPQWMVDGMVGLYSYVKDGRLGKVSNSVTEVTGHEPHTFESFARENAKAFA